MIKYLNSLLDSEGRPVAGAIVTVSKYPSGSASIYTDDGTTSVSSVTTDANGYYEFYTVPGRYTITAVASGIGTVILSDVPVGSGLIPYTDWTDLTDFEGYWDEAYTTDNGSCQYMIDASGIVHFRGMVHRSIDGSDVGESLLTLPSAAYPAYNVSTSLWSLTDGDEEVPCAVVVNTDTGVIYINTADRGTICLNGLSYPSYLLS